MTADFPFPRLLPWAGVWATSTVRLPRACGGAARFDTGDPEYLGWIIAKRTVANERLLELWADEPSDPAYVREDGICKAPYVVQVIELRRDVHESDVYEQSTDYRRNDVHAFATQAEAEAFLRSLGVPVDVLVDPREVDLP